MVCIVYVCICAYCTYVYNHKHHKYSFYMCILHAYCTGKCYLYGRGVQSDPVKAEKMFRYAAQRDDPDAMSLLGHLLLQGKCT